MFIIIIKSIKLLKKLNIPLNLQWDKIFKEAKKYIRWIPLKFVNYFFSPNFHGNVTNQEKFPDGL